MSFFVQKHQSQPFCLDIKPKANKIDIVMEVTSSTLYTSQLPQTHKVLKKHVPSIFKSECFNYKNQPFKKEVKDTEVGHLFEHILLEFLCMEKIANGSRSSTYSGVTKWNWKKEKKGVFHITINMKSKDSNIPERALEKAIEVMENIFGGDNQTYAPALQPASAKFGASRLDQAKPDKKAARFANRRMADRPRQNK